jgi:hypothetical protein
MNETPAGDDAPVGATADDLTPSGSSPARPSRFGGWDWYDAAVVVTVTVATIFLHPFRVALRHPFWLDEAWVAVLTKAPLTRLPGLSSSAPVGFVALLRLVPGSGLQRGRLVVLAFSALTVAATYVLVRSLGWRQRWIARLAALVAALVVMLAPLSLIRNDLKQYTCDAFCAVVLLAVGAWAERRSTRGSLVWFGVASVLTAPFSSTALFVSVAVFAGLLASAAINRARRRVAEVLVAGAATGVALGGYFFAVVAPNLKPKLRAYWNTLYLNGSLPHMAHLSWSRLVRLDPALAMPAWVFVVLFVFGVVVLARLRVWALAVAMPLLWLEMALMGGLERYPFLDLRTSHFLLVPSLVVVALGAIGVVEVVRRLAARLGVRVGWGAAGVVAVALAVPFGFGLANSIGQLHIPAEDVRTETRAVAANVHPRDVIVVSISADFGFSYYWPRGHLRFYANDSGQGFRTEVAGLDAIYVPDRTGAGILTSMREAVARWKAAGRGSRIYIVRSHLTAEEGVAWRQAFEQLGLTPRVVRVGIDPLLVVDPTAA